MRFLWLLPFVAACQLVLPIQEENGDAAADATDDGAADASPDAPVNLVQNPGFEIGLLDAGCGQAWQYSNNVTVHQAVSASHGGGRACEICTTQNQTGVYQQLPGNFPGGSSFAFGAWFTPDPPDNAVTARAYLLYRMHLADGGTQSLGQAGLATSNGAWTEAFQSATPAVPVDNVQLSLQITAASDGGCFIVDDAFVFLQ